MSAPAIRVENLSKQYQIGAARPRHDSLRDHLTDWARSFFRRNGHGPASDDNSSNNTIWALKDVSFQVNRGEVVGIVGRNGAGKSTLLKILSRITEPTEGFADVHGRVGSLLEVGTGFHRDLTGRENVYLNGAIIGMKKAEIDRKFDEIVEFSEIAKFIDTPVKHYSSGMYVRLAFAVAVHLDPEILIIDEVLAVGDAAFQKKCLAKMEDATKQGRTVLFVSHNIVAVTNLCSRAIWFDGGKIVEAGVSTTVVKNYVASTSEKFDDKLDQVWHDPESAPGNDKVRLRRINIRPESDTAERVLVVSAPFRIEIEFWSRAPQHPITVSLYFHTAQGVCMFETISVTDTNWHGRSAPAGLFRSVCHIPAGQFNDGSYIMGVHLRGSWQTMHDMPKAASFTVHDFEQRALAFYGKIGGVNRPTLKWETELLEKDEHAVPPTTRRVPA
jgi:lipopolysaccharide transport system ATP-binding protein